MTLYTVPSTGYAQLIVNAGDGPTMVINRDETNQLYVGTDNSVASKQGTGDIDIIDPLSYIVYDGVSERYAIAAASQIQVNTVKGATNWAPSPAQAALQISLLGLATASNQSSQLTAANLGNLTTGAIQNITGTITGNHIALQSMVGNPFFTLPGNGNADLSGWNNRFGSFQTAGIQGAVGLPAGSGQPNGVFMTATGATTQLQWGPSGATAFPVVPNQQCNAHFMINAQQTGTAFCGFAFFTSGGVFISTISPSTPINFANIWQKVFATVQAPATAAFATPVYGISGGVAGNTFYATSCIAYACGQPGTVANDHAQAISTTGTPLLTLPTPIMSATGALALGITTYGPFSISQIGYEGFLSIYTAAITQTRVGVYLNWSDNGIQIAQDNFYFFAGTGVAVGQIHNIFMRGPTKGSSLTINIQLNDNTCTIGNFQMFQNSRIYPFDLWRTVGACSFESGAANGQSPYNTIANVVGVENVSVGIGATDVFCLPLYTGRVFISGSTASGTNDMQSFITNPSDLVAGGIGNVYNQKSDATGVISMEEMFLPRSQCFINIKNGNAAAKNLAYFLTGADY